MEDLAPVVAERGGELPAPSEDPLAGMPAHVDRYEVTGDGWTVRWGSSNAVLLGDAPATTVTVIGGGEVTAGALQRWLDAGLLADVYPCG